MVCRELNKSYDCYHITMLVGPSLELGSHWQVVTGLREVRDLEEANMRWAS